ncbi:MAG TPA: hypothetical protein VFQ51_18880 [Vicinamibacteria bacterium]|nr:hypothetical protein [Vicinamibacteria bacterium]
MQEAAQKQRQALVRETATAEIQLELVGAEQGVRIVPDVSVTGNSDGGGLLGALMGTWTKSGGATPPAGK